jgi:hypothetical protein
MVACRFAARRGANVPLRSGHRGSKRVGSVAGCGVGCKTMSQRSDLVDPAEGGHQWTDRLDELRDLSVG